MNAHESFRFYHAVPVQIRFNDIDKLDHETNSVYQQYYDLGRMAYFADVLGEKMDWQEDGLILVSITIDFISPVKLYDNVEVRTKIHHIGNKSLKMAQEIFNHSTGVVSSVSRSVMVGYSNLKGEAVPIPHRWRERIASFEHDTFRKNA